MGDLSENFSRSEMKCKCSYGCGFDTVDAELIKVLQDLRTFFGCPIKINSCCRCTRHNKDEGGGEKSQHLLGKAADIVVIGLSASRVQQHLNVRYPDRYGIGVYDSFTHIDSRSTKARW